MRIFRLTNSTVAKAFFSFVLLFNTVFYLNVLGQDLKHETAFNEAIHYFQKSVYPVFDSIYRNFDEIKTLQRATQSIDTIFYYNTSSNKIDKHKELKNILNDKHIILVDDEWHSNYFNKHIELDGKLLWCPIVPYFNGFLIYHNEKSQHFSFLHTTIRNLKNRNSHRIFENHYKFNLIWDCFVGTKITTSQLLGKL